jgi:hypothetical protein
MWLDEAGDREFKELSLGLKLFLRKQSSSEQEFPQIKRHGPKGPGRLPKMDVKLNSTLKKQLPGVFS